MSDEKPKPSIPPELRPFAGRKPPPAGTVRDAREVDAALAPIEAMVEEWAREVNAKDTARGAGNVREYVAPTAVPSDAGGTAGEEPKVDVAGAHEVRDAVRALPEGDRNHPTVQVRARGARAHDDEAPASVKPASSARAPRKHPRGLIIAGTLAIIAAGIVLGTVTAPHPSAPRTPASASPATAPSEPRASASAAATAHPSEPRASASGPEPHAPSLSEPHAPSPSEPRASASGPAAPASPTATARIRTAPSGSADASDPYADAAPPIAKSAAPIATAAPAVKPAPTSPAPYVEERPEF